MRVTAQKMVMVGTIAFMAIFILLLTFLFDHQDQKKSHQNFLAKKLKETEYIKWKPTSVCFTYTRWTTGDDIDPIPCENVPDGLLIEIGPVGPE